MTKATIKAISRVNLINVITKRIDSVSSNQQINTAKIYCLETKNHPKNVSKVASSSFNMVAYLTKIKEADKQEDFSFLALQSSFTSSLLCFWTTSEQLNPLTNLITMLRLLRQEIILLNSISSTNNTIIGSKITTKKTIL